MILDNEVIVLHGVDVLQSEASAISNIVNNFPQDFAVIVRDIVNLSGKLVVSGIGKSGYVARKIAASFASTGTPSFFLHPSEASHGDLGMIHDDDMLLLLSVSGNTKELMDIISYAKRFNIKMIAMTMDVGSMLAQKADYRLILPKVEEISCVNAPTCSSSMMLAMGDALMVATHKAKGFTVDKFKILHPGGRLGANLMHVGEIMHGYDKIPIVNGNDMMSHVLLEMTTKGFGCAIVVENKKAIGIVTDGDLRRHMSDVILSMKAEAVMSKNPVLIPQNMFASEALNIINSKRITALVVVNDKEEVCGIVHVHDLLNRGVK